MNRSDYSSLINGRAIHEDKEEVPTVSEQEMLWVSPPSHVPGVIGEDDMKRAFEQIVNCIHLDEDDYGRKGRKCMVYFDWV